jgi:hypothetical protein
MLQEAAHKRWQEWGQAAVPSCAARLPVALHFLTCGHEDLAEPDLMQLGQLERACDVPVGIRNLGSGRTAGCVQDGVLRQLQRLLLVQVGLLQSV